MRVSPGTLAPGPRVLDLDGKFVTPGYNDNHVHFASTGRLLYGLSLLDVSTEGALVERVREVDERYAPDTWITGGDWSAYEAWAAGDVAEAGREVNPDDLYGNFFLPNKTMIDGFTAERPVLLRRFDRKVYLANSAALAAAGITAASADPRGNRGRARQRRRADRRLVQPGSRCGRIDRAGARQRPRPVRRHRAARRRASSKFKKLFARGSRCGKLASPAIPT